MNKDSQSYIEKAAPYARALTSRGKMPPFSVNTLMYGPSGKPDPGIRTPYGQVGAQKKLPTLSQLVYGTAKKKGPRRGPYDPIPEKTQAPIPRLLKALGSTFGSRRGPGALAPFKRTGGPLMGSAVQSLLLGGAGYGLSRLLLPLYINDPAQRREAAKRIGILSSLGGPLMNMPALISRYRYWKGLKGRDPAAAKQMGLLRALNLDPQQMKSGSAKDLGTAFKHLKTAQFDSLDIEPNLELDPLPAGASYDMSSDLSGVLAPPGERSNVWSAGFMNHSAIPVGQMSSLVGRAGMPRAYSDPIIQTMQTAAGGNRGLISPKNVFDTGMRLGVGYLVGRPAMMVLSKTLGAVAGLPRGTQEKLTNWGTLGSMLYNVMRQRR